MDYELRPFWNKFLDFNWKFGLLLIFLVCVPRFLLVLNANTSGNYGSIGIIMFISAVAPFIFLTKSGRKEIGITGSGNIKGLFFAFAAGLAFSFLLHLLGQSLYANTIENWYNYIGRSYKIPAGIDPENKKILFTIMAFTGMTFSPVGEELFFRGIVHTSFARSTGDTKASVIDSLAFAITHISHFGLVFFNNQWHFLFIPTLLWTSAMFLVSMMFFAFKKYTGSLLGAIIGHAAFNLGMIYCIFYLS